MIPTDPITRLFILARAVHFSACLLVLCVFIFDRLIVSSGDATVETFIDRRWPVIARRLMLLALPAALISGVAWFACNAILMSGLTPREAFAADNLRDVLNSEFGKLWKWRMIFGVMATFWALPATFAKRPSFFHSASTWIALVFGGVLAVSISRAGHGGEGTALHQTADALHVIVGAAWPLGLLPLALLLLELRRSSSPDRWVVMFAITRRFSLMSVISVLLIGGSGVVNSLGLVGSWAALVKMNYGRWRPIKAGLFAVMVLFGAVNCLYLQPRLAVDFGTSTESDRRTALSRLQFNVWMEILLAIGVLVAAGVLGTLEPAVCEQCCGVGGA